MQYLVEDKQTNWANDVLDKVLVLLGVEVLDEPPAEERLVETLEGILIEAGIDINNPIHYCRNCDVGFETRTITLPALLELGQATRKWMGHTEGDN